MKKADTLDLSVVDDPVEDVLLFTFRISEQVSIQITKKYFVKIQ